MFSWESPVVGPDGKTQLLYRHERIFQEGLVKAGMTVLDVGGWGVLAQRLLEEGCETLILDLFTHDQAYPERVRRLPHRVGDVCDRKTFSPETFDVVTCFETLEHVADFREALRSVYLWLRPGGVFVGTIPLPGHIHAGDPDVYVPRPEELLEALYSVGFGFVTVEESASIYASDAPCCTYFKGIAS